MLLRNKSVANADVEELHGADPSLGIVDSDALGMQRVPFGPFLALAAMEFVLLRRMVEEMLTWWSGGAL